MRPVYRLQIITPQGAAYKTDAIHTFLPAEDGFVGVLANHAPYVTSVAGGRLEVSERGGVTKKFQVGSGFFEVAGNEAVLLTQSFANSEALPLSPHPPPLPQRGRGGG